jgi:hypothetical protein
MSLYGEGMGRYGFDPTILVRTARDLKLPAALGVK